MSEATIEDRRSHPGARVLLAEDDPINQELVQLLLARIGIDVDLVADGTEAVQRARDHDYDLLLLDIHMPGLDGLAAARAIRSLPGRENVPIVALTASLFDSDREACLAAGMNDFISKPIMAAPFFETVSRWLEQAARG